MVHRIEGAAQAEHLCTLMHLAESFGAAGSKSSAVCMNIDCHSRVTITAFAPWHWACWMLCSAALGVATHCKSCKYAVAQLGYQHCCLQDGGFTGTMVFVFNLHEKRKGVQSARDDLLGNFHKTANHIKSLYFFHLGFGPYLGNTFGGQYRWQPDKDDANVYDNPPRADDVNSMAANSAVGTKVDMRVFYRNDALSQQQITQARPTLYSVQHAKGVQKEYRDALQAAGATFHRLYVPLIAAPLLQLDVDPA